MKLEELNHKKILLLGYGVEGQATHDFLKQNLPNAVIGIADIKDGEDYLNKQQGYDIAIKSPGVHKSKVTIPYTTATNIFFANVTGMVIAITGTKGKSTTASLIYAILKQAGKKVHLVGNITHKYTDLGKPLLAALTSEQTPEDIYVCELSSFQLDDIKYAPHIAVFTNFFPEHMDFHGNVQNYWVAKKNIAMFTKENNFFVYNPAFPMLADLAKKIKAKSFPFVEELPFPETIIPLLGRHNIDNVRAAVTVAKILEISDQTIMDSVKNFKPLPHRLENIGTYHDLTFFDDAISTTPESTIKAIEAIDNIGTIFLGGQDRGYNFTDLAKAIVAHNIANIVFFPDSGDAIELALKKHTNKKFTILKTRSMEEAVQFAYKQSPKGSAVLLSTASPSYSVWKNFEEKGNLFKMAAQKYSSK